MQKAQSHQHQHQPRSFIGPAALIEVSHSHRSHSQNSHSQHSYTDAYRHGASLQQDADHTLVRLLAATTLCGFGLLILALLR